MKTFAVGSVGFLCGLVVGLLVAVVMAPEPVKPIVLPPPDPARLGVQLKRAQSDAANLAYQRDRLKTNVDILKERLEPDHNPPRPLGVTRRQIVDAILEVAPRATVFEETVTVKGPMVEIVSNGPSVTHLIGPPDDLTSIVIMFIATDASTGPEIVNVVTQHCGLVDQQPGIAAALTAAHALREATIKLQARQTTIVVGYTEKMHGMFLLSLTGGVH